MELGETLQNVMGSAITIFLKFPAAMAAADDPFLGKLDYNLVREYIAPALKKEDIFELSLVRKKYRDLPGQIETLNIDNQAMDEIIAHPEFYVRVWPNIKTLAFRGMGTLRRFVKEVGGRELGHLKMLAAYEGQSTRYLDDLLKYTPELKVFIWAAGDLIPDSIIEKYSYSLKLFYGGADIRALVKCHNLEYLNIRTVLMTDMIADLSMAEFIPKLKYFYCILAASSAIHHEEMTRGTEIARTMERNRALIDERVVILQPLFQAMSNLRILQIDSTLPQIRAVSHLLCKPEICPKLRVLSLNGIVGRDTHYPEASLEGLKLLLSVKDLKYLKYGKFDWPPTTLLEILKSHKLEFFDLSGSNGWETIKNLKISACGVRPYFAGGEHDFGVEAEIIYQTTDGRKYSIDANDILD